MQNKHRAPANLFVVDGNARKIFNEIISLNVKLSMDKVMKIPQRDTGCTKEGERQRCSLNHLHDYIKNIIFPFSGVN